MHDPFTAVDLPDESHLKRSCSVTFELNLALAIRKKSTVRVSVALIKRNVHLDLGNRFAVSTIYQLHDHRLSGRDIAK